nr:recombinase family protein [Myxococcus sp. AM010]
MEGPNDFAVEEGEASVVRQLFKLYATGRFGLTRLKRAAGCPLSESAIANVLSNPFYLGQLRYAGTTRPNAHPAVVSRALFAQVQRIREARTPRSPRAKPLGTLGEACLTHPAR